MDLKALELEREVRSEALSGCEQVRNVESQIRRAPVGGLVGVTITEGGEMARALRTRILDASTVIVEKFNRVIQLLSSSTTTGNPSSSSSGAGAGDLCSHELVNITRISELNLSSNPGSPEHNTDHSSSLSPSSGPTPRGSAELRFESSHHVTTGSTQVATTSLDSDEDTLPSPARRAPAADFDEKKLEKKRRKFLPKYETRQRVVWTGDTANEPVPPEDGYTWRKYGQKDIKESMFPRSYYRCTHKTELGCPASKTVQRSDQDPDFYVVIYKGKHICPPVERHIIQMTPENSTIITLIPPSYYPPDIPTGSGQSGGVGNPFFPAPSENPFGSSTTPINSVPTINPPPSTASPSIDSTQLGYPCFSSTSAENKPLLDSSVLRSLFAEIDQSSSDLRLDIMQSQQYEQQGGIPTTDSASGHISQSMEPGIAGIESLFNEAPEQTGSIYDFQLSHCEQSPSTTSATGSYSGTPPLLLSPLTDVTMMFGADSEFPSSFTTTWMGVTSSMSQSQLHGSSCGMEDEMNSYATFR
ncbi:hypothetical protein R1sor_020208 [Riccia sorocarpa]|uniref:WRKY domain-containing protein n=1 Tax=Riccia sorocarpa TaxID=122646 RepID=A0ABD3IFD8_9MARC